jgi:hypothetical protein
MPYPSKVEAEFLRAFETSNTGTTGLGVFVQDQTTEVIDLKLHKNLNTFTLASDSVLDTFTLTASPGHSILTGNSICFLEGQSFSQFDVTDVVGDLITFDSPMDKVYTSSATAIHHTFDMRTGTASPSAPEIWRIAPIPGQRWDIVRIILVMESTANNMDFTGFGNLSALTNGAILRTKDGVRQNLFNWKTNGDFINRSFDHSFQGKTGGGGSGFVARSTFGGQSKRGVVLRLDGDLGEEVQVMLQDATNGAGLTKFFVIAQGHVVQS